jgi:tetratricopeptide (TPR) repeat protein
MAGTAHYSPATLARAAGGNILPTLDVALAYVVACGGDPAAWRELWQEACGGGQSTVDRAPSQYVGSIRECPPCGSVPLQLPAAPRHFTGREKELERISAQLLTDRDGDRVTITNLCGFGGIGKTSLALEWAHRNAASFPDGQLFVNLRGFDPSVAPVHPATALQGLLHALGVPPMAIPSDPDAQAALYRSLLAGRRLLVVLDDAAETRQVVPLLPGSGFAAVLITSRRRLDGLATTHGARRIRLDVLPGADARVLLGRRLGPSRLDAEPMAVAEILQRCEGVPLALTIAAARWDEHAAFPLADLAAELRDESARLDALEVDGSMVGLRAALGCSYRALTSPAAEMLALLGSVPYPEVDVAAAARLAGESAQRAGTLLRELEDAHLVTQPIAGRFRMHDLVRLYAAEQAARLPGAIAGAARVRLDDFYLHTVFRAERQLYPQRAVIRLPDRVAGADPLDFADLSEALSWLDAECSNVLTLHHTAVARGRLDVVWKLAWALMTYRIRRGRLRDNLACWRDALAALNQVPDQGEAAYKVHCGLGSACTRVGAHPEGLRHLERATALAEAAGDQFSLAEAHFHFSFAWHYAGADREGRSHALKALALFQALGDPIWTGLSLNAAARSAACIGAFDEARDLARAAQVLGRDHDQPDCEAEALVNLGYVAQRTGNPTLALEHYEHAVRIYRARRNVYFEADALVEIGHAHAHLGQDQLARDAWRHAAESYRSQWRLDEAGRIEQLLASTQRVLAAVVP